MRGVSAASMHSGLMLPVCRSTSAKTGCRSRMDDGVRGRAEGQRRGDDFVARPDAGREQRQVQGSGTRIHGDGVRSADVVSEGPLELADPRTGRQPPGAQGRGDFVDFFDTDTRRREGDRDGQGIGLDVRSLS